MVRENDAGTSGDASHSVTLLIEKLRSDDRREFQEAAANLWSRYMGRLLELARKRISPRVRAREDEHDVVQSMFKSVCQRLQDGQYTLGSRDELWRLLVTITQNKARNAVKHHKRQGRDVGREARAAQARGGSAELDLVAISAAAEPTPIEIVIFEEELQIRLKALDEPLRQIAWWKLAGHTNKEIAMKISVKEKSTCSVRRVERKLALIREAWQDPELEA